MPFTLTMPKLSPTMEEGTIAKWHVKEKDHVAIGDVLLEVSTDKATVEHSALDEGYLRKIIVPEGGSARVNQPIAIFTEIADESIEGYQPEGETPSAVVPEPSSEKPSAEEAPAPTEGEELEPSPPLQANGMKMPAFVPEPPLENYTFEEPTRPIQGRVPASPLARKIAREKGIELSTIKGSGPHGRIMSRDLDTGQAKAIIQYGYHPKPSTQPGSYEEEALTPMRKLIGRRLQESKMFVPHFYVTQEVDAEPMAELRDQLKSGGLKATFNDFIVRACALSLREHSVINSGFNTLNQTMIRYKTIDIAIAVSLPDGLITPIIRHADYKNLGEISAEVRNLVKRANSGKLAREEYIGGSFTVSNLGMFGIHDFTAVINPPQAAILAVGGIQEKPVLKNGQVIAGKTMAVTLSSDHRVIDGVDAAKYLTTLKNFLQNPALLIL